jgi:phosphohistidine phosphatase
MKRILLLRHAKSSWDDLSLSDFARPLADRGRDVAPRMGAFMKGEGLVPEAVLCSGARRAVQTLQMVEPFLCSPSIQIEDTLYMAPPEIILTRVRQLEDDIRSVLLIGHNPAFEELALRLAGDGRGKALRRMRKKYPTCALAVLRFEADAWAVITQQSGFLELFARPKDLPA